MKLFLYGTFALFIALEIILNRLFRANKTDKQAADKKSVQILWATIFSAIFVAVVISGKTALPIFQDSTSLYLGLFMIYLGIIIRQIAVYTLGKFFTVDVTIRQGHALKTDGLFKYVRHPNYIALLLSFTGIGVVFNNWGALLCMMIPITCAFIHRINIEEGVLIQHFGDEYLEYQKLTKRLIPYIY